MEQPRLSFRRLARRDPPDATSSANARGGGRITDRFGALLLFLLGAFIAQGLGNALWDRILIGALQLGGLVVAFYSTGVLIGRPPLVILVLGGLVAFGLGAVEPQTGALFATASIVGTVVVLAMLVSVLFRVLRHERVTIQTLYGAVCAYLLIGFFFADLYGAFDSLSQQPIFGEPVARAVYSYFSFVTLTTVGFGDYTAKGELVRRFVALEAVLGQVFIATTLARLVALYRGSGGSRTEKAVVPSPQPDARPPAPAAQPERGEGTGVGAPPRRRATGDSPR